MKLYIKVFVRRLLISAMTWLHKTVFGRFILAEITSNSMNRHKTIVHEDHTLTFCEPNRLNTYRILTFATKEPQTLEWIENIPARSIVWDVGANIGLYSIYAATARKCKVFAFEPSVFNLELLARNIFLNQLQESVCIVPISLSDRVGTNMFKMSNTDLGGALSTFGESFDQNGEVLSHIFSYHTIGVSMDDVKRLLGIPQPQYLKMDVDGIEHFILRGGMETLTKVEGVMIEINDSFMDQANESAELLEKAGLILHKKCDLGVPDQYNQWWIRPSRVTRN